MPTLFALPDAAKSLGGISIWTLRRHISEGRIRVVRIGRRVFLDADEVSRIRREGLPSLRANAAVVLQKEGLWVPR
jgi:predicted site-specific integrase-resolvase